MKAVIETMTSPHEPKERLHLRGRFLPDDEERDVWIVDGKITWSPVTAARTIASGGWILPALVDAHIHIGIAEIGGPLDTDALASDLRELTRTGIGAVRVLGSPEPLPNEVLAEAGGPLVQTAGVPVAAHDRFIPGWGRRTSGSELGRACTEEARFGWSKIIADWFNENGGYGPAFTREEIAEAVAAVHEAGARVSVHTQSVDGGQYAVEAGADSIEHGLHLPHSVLASLASRGGILVPTGGVFQAQAPMMSGPEIPAEIRQWYTTGLDAHPGLVRSARDHGVTVLAGTDQPVGALVDEIHFLHNAGMSAHDAIGAASWTARETLGFGCLAEGDRADLISLGDDPRQNLDSLRSPSLIVIDGHAIAGSSDHGPSTE